MSVTLAEMKNYLRVDTDEDDDLIEKLIRSSEKLCEDILRSDQSETDSEVFDTAVMFTAAYLYEHREEADHHALTLTLRSLLFGDRKAGF
jgi:uncharacterized phage protein (predicted DNA packaging)